MITIDQLQELTPSVFATSPSDKMSDKYVFVPTIKILENFQKEGWEISSATQVGKGVHSIHEIRLRNGGLPKVGDSVLESVIRNSHNGLARFSVSAGLHRFVCSNGLTIPTSVCESLDIKHQRFELDDVKELTESFATRLPVIQSSVSRMMNKELSTPEKMDFIKKAINIRWKTGTVPSTLDVMGMVSPRREEDRKNDLWTVFNVVQENMVRGGVKYQTKNGKPTETRGLKSILALNIVNTKLWELAETIS